MKFFAPALLFICLFSCKTAGNQTDRSAILASSTESNICYQGRDFLAEDQFGFDFNTRTFNPSNVYWSALAASVAYSSSTVVEGDMKAWGKSQLQDFTFFGEGAQDHDTQGFWASFEKGDILSFRGTAGFRDLLTDSIITKLMPGLTRDESGNCVQLRVHSGFWEGLDAVWEEILDKKIRSLESLDLPLESEQAFHMIDTAMRAISEVANIESWQPDIEFSKYAEGLRRAGILKPSIENWKFLQAVNLWATTTLDEIEALKEGGEQALALAKVESERKRRKRYRQLHPHWNFKAFKPLWITGHSLGGALATVAVLRFLQLGIPVSGLVTFGSPRVGNEALKYFVESAAQNLEFPIIRMQNDNDGVTRIPAYFGWKHVARAQFIDREGSLFLHYADSEREEVSRLANLYTGAQKVKFYLQDTPPGLRNMSITNITQFVSDHSMSNYYIKGLEDIVFGGVAPGCETDEN